MNNNILFTKYIEGALSTDEKSSFEERLKTEPEFRKAFSIFFAIEYSITQVQVENAERDWNNDEYDFESSLVPPKRRLSLWIIISLIVLALFGFGLFKLLQPRYSPIQKEVKTIIASYEGSDDGINERVMGANDNWEDNFKANEYSLVIDKIKKLNPSPIGKTGFSLGFSYLKMGQYAQAVDVLSRIALNNQAEGKLGKYTYFYAIALIMNGDNDKALSILQQTIQSPQIKGDRFEVRCNELLQLIQTSMHQ